MADLSNDDSSRRYFIDDDEETLSLMLSTEAKGDWTARLEGLEARFLLDHRGEGQPNHWEPLVRSVQDLGFNTSYEHHYVQNTLKADSPDPGTFPVAFASDDGKLHLKATASALQVSQTAAIQITLSAMRSLASSQSSNTKENQAEASFQSLLGTRIFLEKVLDYYLHQRVARIATMAECLRIEQRQDSDQTPVPASLSEMLDRLDKGSTHRTSNRGLFCLFLSIACRAEETPSLQRWLPCQSLRTVTTSNSQYSSQQRLSDDEGTWKQFLTHVLDLQRAAIQRERAEALEGLLVLLYERIANGVSRSDWALVLVGLHNMDSFFTGHRFQSYPRLPRVATLIAAECVGLWRVLESSWDPYSHPLLAELQSNTAQEELQALTLLMRKLATQAADRLRSSSALHEVPEALAVLPFAVLLRLTYQFMSNSNTSTLSSASSFCQTFADTSMELATVANDQCDALNYFYLVMEELVEAAPVPDPLSTTEDTMPSDSYAAYDQISGYSKEKVDGELTAQSLTYASIGREILGGIVMAFQDTILTIDTSMGSENIGVLCNLAAVVFRNSPILCAQFWNDWNVYTSPGSARYASPFCRVMDTAFTVASSAPAVTTHLSEVHALQAGWPLLRLVSSLVHSADVTEAALTSVLPLGFIRELLQLCTKPLDEALTWCRDVVFDSVHTLSRIGNSASCRTLLREALGNGMHFSLSGPRLLVKCSSLSGGDRTHTQIALGMLSYLSTDAPEEWILDVAASLRELQKNTKVQGSGSSAGENASTQARAEIVACLVRNMSRVMFCSKASEAQKLDFLCVIAENMQTLSAALSASLSSTSKQLFGGYILSYPTAKTIMDCLCNLLNHLRPILELHKLSSIKESALALRNSTITALVSNQGLGKAVMYYATAPVSLNLLLTLDSTVRDKPILQAMQETSAKQSILGIFAGEAGLSYPLMNPRVHQQLSDLLFHIEFLGFDPDTIQARGWLRSDPAKSLFEACASALRLLVQWARHAEDIAANGDVEWHEVGALGPSWLLVESASLPPDNRAATGLSETWVSSSIPNISLLLRYICKDEAKQIPVSVSALTFDLLVQSLEHSKMSLLEKSIPYEGILAFVNNSESFSRTLQGFVPNILRLYKDGGLGKVDLEVEVGQGLLGLQLYATCIDLGLSTASDENSESNPIATLGAIMSDTTDYLKRAGQSSAILPADHGAIDKLRIALESLKVLRSMHRRSETSSKDLDADAVANGWADYITHDDTILPSLVSLIFDQAKLQVTVVGREDDSVQHTKALIVGVTAVALDVLGLEFSRVEKRIERLDLQLPLFRALERCMEQDFSNLAMITKPFVLIRCFAPLPWGSSMESGSENGSYPPPPLSVLHLFSKGTCKPDRTEVGQKDSFDVFAACQWLSAAYLTCTRSSIKCYDTLMQAMLRYELFSSQIDRLVSWSKFTQSLVRVTRRWRCESTNSPLFLMNDEALSVSIITDVLSSVDENIDLVDVSPTSTIAHPRSYWHLERMAKASSDAILTLYCARKDKFSKGAFSNKFFRLLSATTKKMFEILRSRPKVACSICQNFAALAAAIVPEAEKIAASRDRPNSSPYIDPKVELAVTACKMIEAMVNVDIPDNGYQSNTMRLSCLHSSVTLLTTLVSSVHGRDGNVPQRSNISAESLSRTFVDHDVLRSLSQQLENMMSGSFSQSKVNERKDKSRANCTLPLAKAMLELLIALASSGNATMVSLLVSSKVLSWLSVLPSSMDSTTRSPSMSYHGYRADTQQSLKYESQSARATQEDPLHQVWMRTFILFAALVRSSSTIMLHGDTSPFHFCSIAIDFLKLNKSIVSSSLNLSSTFLVAPKSKPVTLAILRESASILFLFVELFGRDVINYFKNTEPDFYDWIVHKCSSLMINLSSFLGASASARELFQALLYFESASFPGNGMSHRPGPMSSSNRLLSDGFASAKHEAIRYSHFISQRYQAVSARELESERTVSNDERRNAVEGTVLESLAVQSLERTCRASVTSDFMSQLEFQAAFCLLSAGTIIWRTHPASSSFVMLSDKEAFHLDSMSVVKVGMDIAFRNVSEMQTGAAAGKTGFGRVVDINTMDCVWEVVLLDLPEANRGANIFVRPHQLAGIEDTSKRTCMFAYKPAPGSSSELKMDDSSLSLGNIILGLRWCEQFYSKPISRQASESGWIAQRLAELLTALLGTEMSVRKITKMHDNSTNRHNGKILAAQLTDLYGEETDSDSNANSVDWMDKRGAGRLKGLLSQQTWTAIRKQLQSELGIARCDKETNRVAHPFC